MAIDFNKLGITPHPVLAFGTQDAYDKLHEAYHEIITSLRGSDDKGGKSLTDRRKAVRAEWRNTVDLPSEDHAALDEVKSVIEQSIFDGDKRALEALYVRLTEWLSDVHSDLLHEVDKVANPHAKPPIGTKDEAKEMRDFAQNTIVALNAAMSSSLPDVDTIVSKTWEELPRGRSRSAPSGGTYRLSAQVFSVEPDIGDMDAAQLADYLTENTGNKWTRARLTDYLDENTESRTYTLAIDGVTVRSRVVDKGTVG